VGALLGAWAPGKGVCVGVFDALTLFGCVVVLLQTLNPSSCPSLQISKAQQQAQSRVVGAWVKLLSVRILVEMFQSLHNCRQLSASHIAVCLGIGQSFAEVGHNPVAAVLYLGQNSTNSHIAGVGVEDELLPWSRVAQDRYRTQCLFQCLKSGLCFGGILEYPCLLCQFGQRLRYIRESGDEPPVVQF